MTQIKIIFTVCFGMLVLLGCAGRAPSESDDLQEQPITTQANILATTIAQTLPVTNTQDDDGQGEAGTPHATRVLSTSIATQATPVPTSRPVGIVQENFVNIREGAGVEYPLKQPDAMLSKGDTVRILSADTGSGCDTWFHVVIPDGEQGWVCAHYVQITAQDDAETMKTATPQDADAHETTTPQKADNDQETTATPQKVAVAPMTPTTQTISQTTTATGATHTPAALKPTLLPIGIVQEFVNVRSDAGIDYPLAYEDFMLRKGSKVKILAESEGAGCDVWYQIMLSNGDNSWVCADYIEMSSLQAVITPGTTFTRTTPERQATPTEATESMTAEAPPKATSVAPAPTLIASTPVTESLQGTQIATTTTTEAEPAHSPTPSMAVTNQFVNVRTGAGTDHPLKYSELVLKQGSEVQILSTTSGPGCDSWLEVHIPNGDEGWVCSEQVRMAGEAANDLFDYEGTDIAARQRSLEEENAFIAHNAPNPPLPLNQRFTPKEGDIVTRVKPGVYHIQRDTEHPLKINVLLFDITAPAFSLKAALGDNSFSGRTRTSYAVEQNEALAGINGDVFTPTGLPEGLMIIDSKVAMSPKHRATFGWTKDDMPFIGYFTDSWTWDAEVIAKDGEKRTIAGLNRECDTGDICLYNEFTPVVPGYGNFVNVFMDPGGVVTEVTYQSGAVIPEGVQVLQGSGAGAEWLLAHIEVGDKPDIVIRTNYPLSEFTQAISGGPLIVYKGEFVQDCLCKFTDCSEVSADIDTEGLMCEDFDTWWKESHYEGVYMPRTGIGYDRWKQTLIVIVVDGYQLGYSRGILQTEFADLFLEFGAYTAMELDGGGSATMVLNNTIMNNPSDQTGERFVANSLLFFWNEQGFQD